MQDELPDCAYGDDSLGFELANASSEYSLPEHRLCAAVLISAARDAARGDWGAHTWFRTLSTLPFSCSWLCDMLDINQMALYNVIRAHPAGVLQQTYPKQWFNWWCKKRVVASHKVK